MPPKKLEKPARRAPASKEVTRPTPAKPARKAIKAAPKRLPATAPPPPLPAEREAEKDRYWEAVGRRKTARARIRLFTRGGEKGMIVNGKPLAEYFRYPHLQTIASEALEAMKTTDRFRVSAKASGGGLHAQAEAIRHGTARALVLFNPDFRKRLKRAGFLTRDPRMKERKKFGLKGARRAPQWQKR